MEGKTFSLAHRDVLVMATDTQSLTEHGILPEAGIYNYRINITFREVQSRQASGGEPAKPKRGTSVDLTDEIEEVHYPRGPREVKTVQRESVTTAAIAIEDSVAHTRQFTSRQVTPPTEEKEPNSTIVAMAAQLTAMVESMQRQAEEERKARAEEQREQQRIRAQQNEIQSATLVLLTRLLDQQQQSEGNAGKGRLLATSVPSQMLATPSRMADERSTTTPALRALTLRDAPAGDTNTMGPPMPPAEDTPARRRKTSKDQEREEEALRLEVVRRKKKQVKVVKRGEKQERGILDEEIDIDWNRQLELERAEKEKKKEDERRRREQEQEDEEEKEKEGGGQEKGNACRKFESQ